MITYIYEQKEGWKRWLVDRGKGIFVAFSFVPFLLLLSLADSCKTTLFFAEMDRLPYLSVAIFLIHTDLFSSITLKTLICVFSADIEGRVYSFKLQGVR